MSSRTSNPPDSTVLDKSIVEIARKARGLQAPIAGAQSVRNATALPFDEALAKERELGFR